jgi:hypothetical protein
MTRISVSIALLVALGSSFSSAAAGSDPSAPLTCNNGTTYTVTGFGKGIVLHVVNSTSNFVVTYAVTGDGTVVRNVPGQQNELTCTTTSPLGGTSYTFQGFFTPSSPANDQTS